MQNCLVFQNKYFEKFGITELILEWKSKGLSDDYIKHPATSDNSLATELSYFVSKIK